MRRSRSVAQVRFCPSSNRFYEEQDEKEKDFCDKEDEEREDWGRLRMRGVLP
jgi:hypothetical protein